MTSETKPPFVPVPRHVDAENLFAAAIRLEGKLTERLPAITERLNALPAIGLPPGYWGDWFARKMPNVLSYLQVYAFIIGQALPDMPLSKVHMLDYGGGWGLMGLMAKEAGVGSVTYLDINDGTTRAIQAVAEAIGLPLDRYICGDETALFGSYNSVVSSDVLEHVYDPSPVFQRIASVCEPGAKVFHQTGANPKSLHQQITLTRLHRQLEPTVCAERRQIIAESGVDGHAADTLAEATRGLNRSDLDAAIAAYRNSGTLPKPAHPTNTCDLTGYWYERLMDPRIVAGQMKAAGFKAEVARCFWGPGRSSAPARWAKHLANAASRLSRRAGLRVTFYYGIAGHRI